MWAKIAKHEESRIEEWNRDWRDREVEGPGGAQLVSQFRAARANHAPHDSALIILFHLYHLSLHPSLHLPSITGPIPLTISHTHASISTTSKLCCSRNLPSTGTVPMSNTWRHVGPTGAQQRRGSSRRIWSIPPNRICWIKRRMTLKMKMKMKRRRTRQWNEDEEGGG